MLTEEYTLPDGTKIEYTRLSVRKLFGGKPNSGFAVIQHNIVTENPSIETEVRTLGTSSHTETTRMNGQIVRETTRGFVDLYDPFTNTSNLPPIDRSGVFKEAHSKEPYYQATATASFPLEDRSVDDIRYVTRITLPSA